jgi:hypothetical protein
VVVATLLQHPEFIYRIERGTSVAEGVFALDRFEIGTRLSYLLWGSTPSEWLLDAAEAGELQAGSETLRAVADEMLDDPRALQRIDRFQAMWIGYDQMPPMDGLAGLMREETAALVQRVVFEEERPWKDVFRMTETLVDSTLAEHYGLADVPEGEEPVWTSYAGTERQGLLSHGTFLSQGAGDEDTSPTQRGLIVRTQLLCQAVPEPPPDVDADVVPEDGLCKQDQLAAHASGGCASCHELVDPIGFGLENYDQLGLFRTQEPLQPTCKISGEGRLTGLGLADETFNGPQGLADRLLETDAFTDCFADQLYRFTSGRTDLTEPDAVLVERLHTLIDARSGEFRLRELVLELVSAPEFGFRREEEV